MKKQTVDLVDFHSHILPGVDHGCSSPEVAKLQLSFAKKYGVSRIIATSHFYPHIHNIDSFLQKRNKAFEIISEIDLPDMPEILLGSEVFICENLQNLEGLENLCIAGTRVILLELPYVNDTVDCVKTVNELIERGFTIVLAHADRYLASEIDKLIDIGVKIQLNADALCKLFIRPAIRRWLQMGVVVGIGSDIHKKDKSAYSRFDRAKRRISKYLQSIADASDAIWYSK
jgi:protein-tyrosine phosphatase